MFYRKFIITILILISTQLVFAQEKDATEGYAIDLTGVDDVSMTIDWDATEVDALTWSDGANASNTWTMDLSGTNVSLIYSSALLSLTGGFTCSLDLIVTGGDITLGTSKIFSGGDTTSLNLIDAIDATTESTIESAIDTLPNLTTANALTAVGTLTELQVDNVNINGNTISTDAGTDLNITPLAGQQIVLDGTIVVDAGVVTGATSITSTAFAGALTGNVTGNVSGSAGTVTTITGLAPDTATTQATQPNITSLGTLTTLTVDNLTVNGNTINADTGAVNITPAIGSAIVLDGTINVDAGVVTGATSITSTAFVGDLTGNADTVTTNANLTGVITSIGNATSIASQTGTGTKFVVDTSPTLVTPTVGVATATSINKVAITAPATSSTLTIADGQTLTVNGTAIITNGTHSGTNTGDNTVATSGDAAVDFFGASVTAVTDVTACTDLEGTGLSITTGTLNVATADTTTSGIVEIAIASEVDTGADATRAISPDAFQDSKRNIRWLSFNLIEKATNVATATNITGDFVSPIAGTILQSDTTPFYLYATNSTAGINTGVGLVVDISIGGTSIMTTNKLDFDTTEKTTTTSATPPDLTTTALAVGDIITIDVDSIHDGTASKGLTLYMGVKES